MLGSSRVNGSCPKFSPERENYFIEEISTKSRGGNFEKKEEIKKGGARKPVTKLSHSLPLGLIKRPSNPGI